MLILNPKQRHIYSIRSRYLGKITQKEKKQTHIKNKIIENRQYETFTVNEGDDTIYDVQGFDPDIMLPDEDVYVVKKKEKKEEETEGLETFMETDKDT